MSPSTAPSRRFALLVTGLVLLLFGVFVAGLTWRLRERLRASILAREAEAIHAVALLQLSAAQARTPALATTDPAALLYAAVLESSRLRGMLAVQLFTPSGQLVTALPDTGRAETGPAWWPRPLAGPVARFHPRASLEELFGAEVEPGTVPTYAPLLEIVVPLRLGSAAAPPDGLARYWVTGEAVAAEWRRLDRGLAGQAGSAFVGAALLVGAILGWAFARMAAAHRQLAAQQADLQRANRELEFAAKTEAVGAISAHLIHGLKNPLAGLESFVADSGVGGGGGGAGADSAWQAAVDTTRRLRALIQEVVTVLGDEEAGRADYPLPVAEFLAAAGQRARAAADAAGVTLQVGEAGPGRLLARTANLAGLALANLVQNAIDASPRGAVVRLVAQHQDHDLALLIEDAGPGLSAEVRARLFQPVRSAKRQGGGIGLAISRQLARHAGGELELHRSDATGTVFCLRVPLTSPET